ncbi:MAG TPA: hypothetical protein VN018_07655 [Brevundimonas sp.]|nr:hypothetical protein [Brevundimonas sp.]
MTGTFKGCIDEAAAKGEISEEVAASARKTYDSAHAAATEAFGPADADRHAADAVMSQLELAALEAKRRKALMIRSRETLVAGIDELKRARGYVDPEKLGVRRRNPGIIERVFGRKPPAPPEGFADEGVAPGSVGPLKYDGALFARSLELIVENKPGLSGGPFSSVQGRYEAIRGQADALMVDLIEKFETRTGFDKPGRADLGNLVREAFGEETGDAAAKALAQAWSGTAEHLRLMYNAAGGSIGKIENWGLPQAHDAHAVRKAGRQKWMEFVMPRLDPAKMIDKTTGRPFTPQALVRALDDVFETISTNGLNMPLKNDGEGLSALARRRSDSRFLMFRNADAWMEYQQNFGDADPFSVMLGHADEISRDIATMQVLGPNPAANWKWLVRTAKAEAAKEEAAGVVGAIDKAEGNVVTAGNMLGHFSGEMSRPVSGWIAQLGATTRNLATAAKLGSALLSDMPTAGIYGAYARKFLGLSTSGDMTRLVNLLNPVDGSGRATARRSGFIIETAADGLIRSTNDNLRLMTVGERLDGGFNALTRRMPTAMLRVTGLTAWDAARKRSFQAEFMGALHDRRGKTIADLRGGDTEDKAFAGWLKARGFSEQDWASIRAAPVWEPRPGAQFLRPMDVPDQELALRLAEAITTETRMAVPQGTLWSKAKLVGAERPGTVWGELRRNWAQFRSFNLTATSLWVEEMALRGQKGGMTPLIGTAAHLAPLMLALTVGGALAIQLREISKGNDPKPMSDPRFWAAAMLQGGGLGVLADAIFASEARAGKSSQAAAFGPVGQMGADAYDLTAGNAIEITEGRRKGKALGEAVESANIGRDASRFVRSWTPGNSIWWTRAAWNRGVMDSLQRLLDPEAEKDFERQRRRLKRDSGQEQWWGIGQTTPERAPDLSNAMVPAA